MARALIALAALLPVAATAAPIPPAAGKQPPPYTTTVGTTRVYDYDGREVTEVVTAAETKDGATTVTIGRRAGDTEARATYRVSAAGFSRLTLNGNTHREPFWFVKYPAKPGDRWDLPGWPGRPDGTKTVIGPERIKVGGATYDAVRVDTVWPGRPGPITSWYAPGVGLVRETGGGYEMTLKSFTPGKE